ncbi:hypothetical protein UlMin_042883 [Ulmus minor]
MFLHFGKTDTMIILVYVDDILITGINKACQFMHSPTSSHWLSVKRILRYLKGTMQQGLRFNPSQDLHIQAYIDADYASTPNDRKSSSGYCIFFGDNLVSWSATKQKVVFHSSA